MNLSEFAAHDWHDFDIGYYCVLCFYISLHESTGSGLACKARSGYLQVQLVRLVKTHRAKVKEEHLRLPMLLWLKGTNTETFAWKIDDDDAASGKVFFFFFFES